VEALAGTALTAVTSKNMQISMDPNAISLNPANKSPMNKIGFQAKIKDLENKTNLNLPNHNSVK
jgi:hypothetical protein